jgi:hypothetical protein
MSKEKKDKNDFYIDVCIKGAHQLRNRLKVDEQTYQLVAGFSHHFTRDYYLYGILDEIEKVGIALMRYREFLSDADKAETRDRVTRNVLGSIYDEQELWKRKLNEILAELILFQNTNTLDYYRHYLFIRELTYFKRLSSDFRDFYSCDNKNIKYSINRLRQNIKRIEQKIEITKCWYLQSIKPNKDRELTSARKLFFKAIEEASPGQKLILGLTYQDAFTGPSMNIHAHIGSMKKGDITTQRIQANIGHLSLLSAHIILLAKKLVKAKFRKGLLSQLNRAFIENKYPQELFKNIVSPKIQKGDFVLAYKDLAEVINVNKSRFGYKSFAVRYLSRPPISEITEESMPARYVKLLFKRRELGREVRSIITDHVSDAKISSIHIAQSLREQVVELWENAGLKEHLHGRADLAKEKMKNYLLEKRKQPPSP